MKQKKEDPNKTHGFKAPKGYFSQVEEQILNEVNLTDKVNQSGFEVPESYFDTLESKILNKVSYKNETKVIPIVNWRNITYTTAVAASLILMLNVFFNTTEKLSFETIEIASIEHYLEEGDITSYELAALLTDEELNSFNLVDSEISEDSIEDYLLNNATIEELIIE